MIDEPARAALLAALVLAFVALFLLPGLIHWLRLRRIYGELSGFELRTPPGDFLRLFGRDERLAHLWKEFQDSLHVQREEREGQMSRWRFVRRSRRRPSSIPSSWSMVVFAPSFSSTCRAFSRASAS